MEDPQSLPEIPQTLFKKRNTKSKAIVRKREVSPPPASDSDSGYTSSEDEEGRQIKKRRKNAGIAASSTLAPTRIETSPTDHRSSLSSTIVRTRSNKDDATKSSNWYDEATADRSSSKQSTTSNLPTTSNGTYKGVANYQSFIPKNPDRTTKQVGPMKSSTNVRTITVTDFAPDVCKDYKQTGFCGFGDSCKFLHAREDYKQGWELDRDWEIDTKGKKLPQGKTVASASNRGGQATQEGGDDDDEKLLESIPFACVICKQPYQNPIITKCGHYFCEACALKRYRKDPSCAVCATGTGGVFNTAKKLTRLLERKRERARMRREKAMEQGEEAVGGDEEEAQV